MDDPISALDANVKKKIFTNVFNGALKGKTRVLVTHAVDFLHLVDMIILMKDGEVILQGSFNEIKDDPYLQMLKSIHQANREQVSEVQQEGISAFRNLMPEPQQGAPPTFFKEPTIEEMSMERPAESNHNESKVMLDKDDSKIERGKMISDEQDEEVEITLKSYANYFGKYWGGWSFLFKS